MSSIRVSGNTSGYYDLTVPDVAGTNTIPLNQVVTTDATGNLGVGTDTPSSKLDLVGDLTITDGNSYFDSSDEHGYARFTHNYGNAQIGLFRTGNSIGGMYIGGNDSQFAILNQDRAQRWSVTQDGAVQAPYQPHWFGTNTNTYTTDSSTWITHGSGNNGGVNTGILKFNSAYSSSGSEWNGQRYTATVAGLYHWEITLDLLNPAGIVFRGAKNGSRFHDEERIQNISGGGWWNYNFSGYVYLSASDYFEFQLTNGTWSNIAGGVWSKMGIRLVG